jgi:hypothetical protein
VVSICTANEPAEKPQWQELSAYQQRIISALLPADPEPWDQATAFEFLSEHGTRSSVYLTLGMLLRDGPNDRANGAVLVREVLKQQIVKPGTGDHGIWRGAPGSEKLDQNWREFVGVGLIAVREWFPDALDEVLAKDVDLSLVRAAEGASARDVGHDYTNIALMSAFLLDYMGHVASRPEWIEQGVAKARAIREAFRKDGTFAEYNSPTYYGTDLMGLGLWCRLARSSQLRQWGEEIETDFWRDIGQFYHADLRNLCGPYSRAYGMDMTKYPALTGLPIAFELDGKGAPLPEEPTTRLYEWAYAAFFSLLDRPIPAEVTAQFREFGEPRHLVRKIDTGRRVYEIEARLEEDWMMGTVVGMNRPWDQHCPATVHWRTGTDEEVGWLLVHGTSGVDTRMVDRSIRIFIPRPDSERPLKVYLYDSALPPEKFAGKTWDLPGMRIGVETPLGEPKVAAADDSRLGPVLAVTWEVPQGLRKDEAVLVLTPLR